MDGVSTDLLGIESTLLLSSTSSPGKDSAVRILTDFACQWWDRTNMGLVSYRKITVEWERVAGRVALFLHLDTDRDGLVANEETHSVGILT
eukprot:5564968-Amphidinium_carterae.1